MTKYKAYPEYKDSGVEWLGNMPTSWERISLRFLVSSIRNGSTATQIEHSEESVAISRIETISSGEINMSKVGFVDSKTISNTYKLMRGDLLLSHINSLPMVGNVALKRNDDVLYHGMNLLRIISEKKIINSSYLYWIIKSSYCRQIIESVAKPAINQASVSIESLKAIQLIIPKLKEQAKIVSFLDHETTKIDSLIEKQQQLIELLKEKRQAVISHAVTKGLNPDVPMKDSGVEWLGDVPKHWKCGYLRWYISVSSGTYLNNKDFETDESNDCINPVIGGNGVMGFTSKINDGNCLVVGRVGALCGNVHQIRRACWVTDNALKITYGCDFDVDYLEMYLKVLDLNKLANHNAQPLITGAMIKEQVAIIPSMDEQKNITKFIQSKVGKIDLLIRKSSEAVDKIKERRTALISAAVTGKIDVRDWVAPDTKETEKTEETAE